MKLLCFEHREKNPLPVEHYPQLVAVRRSGRLLKLTTRDRSMAAGRWVELTHDR
jgi:hypothetical protein